MTYMVTMQAGNVIITALLERHHKVCLREFAEFKEAALNAAMEESPALVDRMRIPGNRPVLIAFSEFSNE